MKNESKRQIIGGFVRISIAIIAIITSTFLIWESFFDGPDTILRKAIAIIIFILSEILLFIEFTIDPIDMDNFFED